MREPASVPPVVLPCSRGPTQSAGLACRPVHLLSALACRCLAQMELLLLLRGPPPADAAACLLGPPGSLRGLVRQLSIDQFENESRRVSIDSRGAASAAAASRGTPMFERTVSEVGVHRLVLREFLNPRHWRPSEDRKFFLEAEQINELCDAAENVIREEPSVLRLSGARGWGGRPGLRLPRPRPSLGFRVLGFRTWAATASTSAEVLEGGCGRVGCSPCCDRADTRGCGARPGG
jgi:hypothetical protein